MEPELALNLRPLWLSPLHVGIIGVHHRVRHPVVFITPLWPFCLHLVLGILILCFSGFLTFDFVFSFPEF